MKTKSSLKSLDSSNKGVSKINSVVSGLKAIERVYGSERFKFFRNETSLDSCCIICLGLVCVHNLITPVVFEDLNDLSKSVDKGLFVSYDDNKLFIEFQFIV